MALFRDKLTGKQTTPKQVQQKISQYDETWIKINVVGGQTQLCPIKLNCSWAYPNVSQRPPQLTCKWFNKTQSQIKMIEGVFGSYYQPCLADVGTIIHVQCIPELQDAEYEGMPIIKQIGPVKIDKETEQQSNDLLSAQKATFSIKLKNGNTHYQEGLIKILGSSLKITTKINQQEKQVLNQQIYSHTPTIKCNRTKAKQIEVEYINKDNETIKIGCELTNNKVRDILVLMVKIIGAKRQLNIQSQQLQTRTEQAQQQNKIENVQVKQISQTKQEIKLAAVEQKKQQPEVTTLTDKKPNQQLAEDNIQKNQQQLTKETQVSESNKDSNKDNSKKSQISQEQIQISEKSIENKKQQTSNKPMVNQIKSSEDFTTNSMTSPTIKKGGSKIQQPSPYSAATPNSKQNTLQILQITDLKKQLRTSQTEVYQLKKGLTEKSDAIHRLQEQLKVIKQRQASLNNNYFQLQDQIKKIKENSQKNSQQISYYKNQNRILKGQIQNTQKKNKTLTYTINQLELKLAPYVSDENDHQNSDQQSKNGNEDAQKEEKVQSYKEIKEKYLRQCKLREELEAKYQYMKQQAQKSEQKYKEINQGLEQVQNEKNYYKKKYENLLSQFQNYSITSSPIKNKSNSKQQKIQQQQKVPLQHYTKLEKEILQLKQNIKQLIQENNFLRSININVKDKKSSSSKTQLKVELLEMKKIVNRLTEAVTEKDMALDHFKKINKQISQKLIDSNKKIQALSTSNLHQAEGEQNSR